MSINLDRLKGLFKEINAINDDSFGEGMSRLAYTPQDKAARELFIKRCKEAGLSVRVDAIGNIFARREGNEPNLPAIAFGSHLDTVINGGQFDGILGVLGGLEVICSLNDENIKTKHPLELIVFECEESSRFNIATLGSKVMCGKLGYEKLKEVKDFRSQEIGEIFGEFGIDIKRIEEAKNLEPNYKSFFEIHIEQGPLLDNEKIQIGVVSAIAAPHRFSVRVIGQPQHSGTTAMKYRNDALCAAAEIILAVEKIAKDNAQNSVVATTGNCSVKPGVMNVVPGETTLLVDLRGINLQTREEAYEQILAEISRVEKERVVKCEIKQLAFDTPCKLNDRLINLIASETKVLNLSHEIMPSGAGHDAMHMAEICPTAMIFIPSKNGISHNPAEFSKWDDIEKGVELLRNVILKEAE
ncbi:Zn-dependent hydrolase [Campylobacter sp. RM16192]|uniref:Zn-dependent hydrolase n=1 Tax=Campylobacter sp. RM16192 TaxID=1660080 RepID=UPI001451917B|nr:Zn-dependent hydrolase [Campylobacter sp. RM16192]QCD52171.1 allantoate amidohydrolase [Campylobacter sp. RM16192]